MTIPVPEVPPVPPVSSLPPLPGTVPSIVPFTIREAPSFLHILEQMRYWITNTLVPYINENVQGLDDKWNELAAELIAAWEAQSAELIAEFERIKTEVDADAAAAEIARQAAEAAALLAEQYASEAEAIQDQAIASIVSNPASQTRSVLDGLYAGLDAFNTLSLAVNALSGEVSTKAEQTDLDATNARVTATETDIVAANTDINANEAAITTTNDRITGRTLYGDFADLPAAASVEAGTQFAAVDVPELYQSTGSEWLIIGAGGNEIGYAEQVQLVNNGGTTLADVQGLTTTFIVGKRPIAISLNVRTAISDPGSVGIVEILMDNARIGALDFQNHSPDVWETKGWERVIHSLAEGSTHTVRCRFALVAPGTGVVRVGGDNNNPNNLKVVTV